MFTRQLRLAMPLTLALSGLAAVAVTPTFAADPVLVGAGDIASCSGSGDDATARLLDTIPGTVFTVQHYI